MRAKGLQCMCGAGGEEIRYAMPPGSTLRFGKVLDVWLVNHPLLVFNRGDQPFQLNQGPRKDRLSHKKSSAVLKTAVQMESEHMQCVAVCEILSSMTEFEMLRTFTYADRANTIPMSKTHRHFMQRLSVRKCFGLIYPLMCHPKKKIKQQLNLPKLYMNSDFSNNFETSGL